MGEASRRSPRRNVPQEVRQGELRRRLANLYRQDAKYQNIVRQDIRPHWLRIAESEQLAIRPTLENLLTLQTRGQEESATSNLALLADIGTYTDTIHRTVGSSLRLTHHGSPAGWAASFVHSDASRPDAFAPPDSDTLPEIPILPLEDFSFRLTVWPTFANLYLQRNGRDIPIASPASFLTPPSSHDHYDVLEADLSRNAGLGYGPEQWEELENEVQRLVHQGVGILRRRYEEIYPFHNAAALSAEEIAFQELFRFLFHRYVDFVPASSFGRATRQRWLRLTKILEIDLPRNR